MTKNVIVAVPFAIDASACQTKKTQFYVFLVPPSNNKRKMHLWPTMRIRESFKISYLKKYDWNLQRMNSEKKRQSQEANDNSNQQRLLDDAGENSRNQQTILKLF